jgi:iron complex outermembrane receptor protein
MDGMNKRGVAYLLATSMLVCVPAFADALHPAPQERGKKSGAVTVRKAARRSTAVESPQQAETVGVVGHGSTRQEQTLTGEQILSRVVPGTTPLKALGTLPGVSFNSSDPLGIDLWSQSFYVRGFTALGFTLDGIPLGGQGYGSMGANINTAISSQNISKVTVSQGAGAVDVPAANNLGGVMQFYSSNPADKFGGKISQTFGSNDGFQTFVRIDSGRLNPSGTKFFVSYNRTSEDKWKGTGSQFLQQVNFKLVQPIGQSTTLSTFFDWDESAADTYGDLSENIINKLGYRVDY